MYHSVADAKREGRNVGFTPPSYSVGLGSLPGDSLGTALPYLASDAWLTPRISRPKLLARKNSLPISTSSASPVQISIENIFLSFFQKLWNIVPIPPHREGRIAIVTARRARDAVDEMATRARKRADVRRQLGRRNRVVPTPRRWCQVGDDAQRIALAMVANKPGAPGRSRISRKTIAQGMPGCLG
jgi:hypothetical protein